MTRRLKVESYLVFAGAAAASVGTVALWHDAFFWMLGVIFGAWMGLATWWVSRRCALHVVRWAWFAWLQLALVYPTVVAVAWLGWFGLLKLHASYTPLFVALLAMVSAGGGLSVATALLRLTGSKQTLLRRALLASSILWPIWPQLAGWLSQRRVAGVPSFGEILRAIFFTETMGDWMLNPGIVLAWQLPAALVWCTWLIAAERDRALFFDGPMLRVAATAEPFGS